MKKSLFTASLLLVISNSVLAHNFNLNGTSIKLGLGFANLASDIEYYHTNGGTENNQYGRHGALGSIALGYSKSFHQKFNLASSLFYNVGSKNSGFYVEGVSRYEQSRLNHIWGFSIEPGYHWSNTVLGYLKIGVAHASSESTVNNPSYADYQYGSAYGPLYGFGLQKQLAHHIFIGIESYHVDFGPKTSGYAQASSTNRPSITYNAFNIGYKF